jgi:hypothetical protein
MNNYAKGMKMRSKVKRIDIKEGMPPVDVAMFYLQTEMNLSKKEGFKVLKVVHGYGSHGKGGSIKLAVRQFLKEAKRKGVITDYVPGEGWSSNKVLKMGLLEDAPELLLNLDGESYNLGVTIIIL